MLRSGSGILKSPSQHCLTAVWLLRLGSSATKKWLGKEEESLNSWEKAAKVKLGVRRSRMVDNGVENEVHSTFMKGAANLFRPPGVPKWRFKESNFLVQ